MTRPSHFTCILVFGVCLGSVVASGAWAQRPDWLPVPTEAHTITSALTGRTYHLSVYLPAGYAEKEQQTYPLVVALDGDTSFDELAAYALQQEGKEAVVVGIGFGAALELPDRQAARFQSYTPRPVEDLPGSGGGEAFLQALEEEVLPWVAESYRVEEQPRLLAGHSLGGFFSLYVLFAAPTTFSHYIALSPSVAIEDFPAERAAFALPENASADVFLGVGGAENPTRMLAPNAALAAALFAAPLPNLQVTYALLPGKTHAEVPLAGLRRGVRTILP